MSFSSLCQSKCCLFVRHFCELFAYLFLTRNSLRIVLNVYYRFLPRPLLKIRKSFVELICFVALLGKSAENFDPGIYVSQYT